MNILSVIDSFGIGGAETQLAVCLGELSSRGHTCVACSVEGPRSSEVVFSPAIRRVYLNKTSPLTAGLAAWRLSRFIAQLRPDVVYSRLPLANGLARIATWLARGARVVAGIDTVPEGFSPSYGYGLANRIYRRLERFADRIVCNSPATASAMIASGLSAERVLVVPNGVDIDKFVPAPRPKDHDVPTLICVAALRPEKGVGRLVGLMAKLLERRPARLVIVGDGTERSRIEGLIAAHSIGQHVELLGMRDDIPQLLQRADILVSTAHVEGFGIAVAEGAAAGLPVVAFDAKGGLRDLIHHEQTGLLVPPGRDDLFVAALERLCNEPEVRRRFGSAGRDHIVKNFSLQATMPLLNRALTQWD